MKLSSLLTPNGWLVTILVAGLYVVAGLLEYLLYPLTFLILGSLISRLNPNSDDARGRTATQVLANGGVSVVLVLCFILSKSEIFEIAIVVSFSAALADTFSSEVGRRFGGVPFDVLSMKPMQAGLSGGVTIIGTLAGLCGAGLMTLMFLSFGDVEFGNRRSIANLILCLGFLGMLVDSFFGSLIQAKYAIDDRVEESGSQRQLIKGYHWVDNSMVNLISILIVTIGAICLMKFYF